MRGIGRFFEVLRSVDRRFGGKQYVIELSILALILAIAFILRVLPIRWGVALSEFDPWMQFKEARFIIDRGWGGFIEFFNWHDYSSWYPYGRDVGITAFPGLPFSMAFIYNILAMMGLQIDPLELAAMLPVVYGVVSVVIIYFLGRELGGGPTGLAAALFLAISAAHIGRTYLGWFDDESLSIPLMLGGYLLFLLAIKEGRSEKGVVAYSILAGLLLGFMAASWGAHKFPLAFIPLFTVFLALIGRYRTQLLTATAITYATYSLIAIMVPKLGVRYLFEFTLFSGILSIGLLIVFEIASHIGSTTIRRTLPYLVIIAGIIIMGVAIAANAIKIPSLKFLSVLLPWLRDELPIIESVAENQLSTWAVLFSDFGVLLLFVPYGLYIMLRRADQTSLFIALFTILSIYFSASMVRLVLIAAPAVALAAGQAFTSLFSSLGQVLSAPPSAKKRQAAIPKSYAILTPLLILFFISYSLLPGVYGGINFRGTSISPVDQGYQPVTLLSSSIPIRGVEDAWPKALAWMRDNLPSDAVVASWWDYGYWITVLGNKTTLIDNATLNSTQIGEVAYAFMSDEKVAVDVFRRYGVTHVVIFVTGQFSIQGGQVFGSFLGFGEVGKWIWMLRIAKQTGYQFEESEYMDQNFNPTDKFWQETLLGQLIPYKPRQIGTTTQLIYEEPQLEHFRLVYASSPPYRAFAYVYIYEVLYPES